MTIIIMKSVLSNRDEEGRKRPDKALVESLKRNGNIPAGPGNGSLSRLSTHQPKLPK